MKTHLVFLVVIITVSLAYAHNEGALKSSNIAAKLREVRNVNLAEGEKSAFSLRDRIKHQFDEIKEKLGDLKDGDVMTKRSTSMIQQKFREKLEALKKLKEN